MNFDAQAGRFDGRAGIGVTVARAVAKAVCQLTAATRQSVLLELGAGTGEIGCWLARSVDRYVGLDSSAAMLARFAARQSERGAILVHGDGDLGWPIARQSVDVVFGSRCLHLLHPQHVVAESLRVGRASGLYLVAGRIIRDATGIRSEIRREMHRHLRAHGNEPRSGQSNWEDLRMLACKHGAYDIESARVASWQVKYRPDDILDAWASKPGLAGVQLPRDLQRRILTAVRSMATDRFGDLGQSCESQEHYELQSVCFPGPG